MILGRGDLKIEMIFGGKSPILRSQSQPAIRDKSQTAPGGVTRDKNLIKHGQGLEIPFGRGPAFILNLNPGLILFNLFGPPVRKRRFRSP